MKNFALLIGVTAVCCVLLAGGAYLGPAEVSAQRSSDPFTVGKSAFGYDADKKMAAEISRSTNRSSDGLVSKSGPNGVDVDLEGRFQNLMLTRLEDDGSAAAACITSLGEANAFFGRNLETGERIPRTEIEKSAADHGITPEEYAFYQRMIAEARAKMAARPEAATITIVNNDGAGEGFNDPAAPFVANEGGNNGATLGAQRLNVFTTAAAIWGSFLDSSITTQVGSQFNPLTCTPTSAVLGSAGAATVSRDFPNAPFTGTWYHGALANKIRNADGSGGAEITAQFNSSIDTGCFSGATRFYYGLDGVNPGGTINLMVVVLHELGHGLGFSSFANGATGALFSGFPDVYNRFTFDQTTGLYWHQMSDAQRQASAINNGNVFWDGPNVRIASSFLTAGRDAATGRVGLHTPATFSSGSSVSHFTTAATPNLLMEPSINAGLPITGDLARQQMRDIGWYRDTTSDVTADTITGVTPSVGGVVIGSIHSITWVNNGGFNRNVRIELSTDGGATYPTIIASDVANTGSFAWTVPNTPTSTARIRVREADFAAPSGSSSGNFTISLTPLAGGATITGRVVDSTGRAIPRATIVLTDGNGVARTALTNQFGYFVFVDVPVGEAYLAAVSHKRFSFEQRIINLTDNFANLDFTALN